MYPLCPIRKVYDKVHIRLTGYRCRYRHLAYYWPCKWPNYKFTLISDSICKNVKYTKSLFIQAFPGATIERLTWMMRMNLVYFKNYRVVVLHVGTNNVNRDSVDLIIEKMKKLVVATQRINPKAKIFISGIIPRYKDDEIHRLKVLDINKYLVEMCKDMNCRFLRTYRPFLCKGACRQELYAKDGLHLNYKGTQELKGFFEGNSKHFVNL